MGVIGLFREAEQHMLLQTRTRRFVQRDEDLVGGGVEGQRIPLLLQGLADAIGAFVGVAGRR